MLLDFEKPIVKLEEKLAKMQAAAKQKDNPKLIASINKLANDIIALRHRTFQNLTRWQRVQLARHPDRPYTLDYIQHITEDFVELHGDRLIGDDKAIVGGFGMVDGKTIMFIGHQKGRTTKERQMRNFGMPNPEGYRKALRLMRLAEKFGKPIVTFIDTPGAYPGLEAEERGQAEAIATNIQTMFGLRVPIICIVIGEGASGGALGIAIGDRVLMLEHTWYSVITPESCSAILWKSWDYKEQAAEILQLTANDMSNFGLIDQLIAEPIGGAHRDFSAAAAVVKENILKHLTYLETQPTATLLKDRTEKFCAMGKVS
ncbi:acetyl-CoA carboxylase carboxyltransferase subunit alpha [Cardinium endosymbiont of Tipula unca]|uniref:acetyl-CoA carboxylase carboxyltransferase subunit alpha n=1 Tax=Cardinium endosymbiont of Tipula unca TaxID=3066216 RepID=UPI0030D3ED2A